MVSQAVSSSMLSLLRCGVGAASYGLEMTWVRSILRSDQLRGPGGSAGLVGQIAGPQGNIPVYGLADRLGQAGPVRPAIQHIVVIHDDVQPWGLLVDHVSQVIRVPAVELLPLPAFGGEALQVPVLGVVQLERELLLLLEPSGLGPHSASAAQRSATRPRPRPASIRASRQTGDGQQLVLFSTASPAPGQRPLWFGLSITQVQEVLEPLPLTRIPGVPDYIHGLVNWRKQPVVVMDLDHRLGLPARPAAGQERLLIAQATKSNEVVGFPVHSAVRVLRLPVPHQPRPAARPLDASLVCGVVELKNETLVIPDLSALVGTSRRLGS